jgi:hypothetical protein
MTPSLTNCGRFVRAYWITAAEHGMNASTFTARVVASTGADVAAPGILAVLQHWRGDLLPHSESKSPRQRDGGRVAGRLWVALSEDEAKPRPEQVAALNAALNLLADTNSWRRPSRHESLLPHGPVPTERSSPDSDRSVGRCTAASGSRSKR